MMRLNWLSPLPAAETGIAEYVWQVLPFLKEQAEITLWTQQTEWHAGLEDHAVVKTFPADDFWRSLNEADMTIYHIGNNAFFHADIWQISGHHPGVVILHDLRLHHFFAGIFLDYWKDPGGYREIMRKYYGNKGARAADSRARGECTDDDLASGFPLSELAVETALGVMVHTRDAYESLSTRRRWPLTLAPLPYSLPTEHIGEPSSAKQEGTALRLLAFGHLWPNRRLDSLLIAFSQLEAKEHYRLDLYGRLWDERHISEVCTGLGIDQLVRFHGFVSEQELHRALAAADLVINLRCPSMGEASLSQLVIWSHALPSLVTRVGWYSELPERVVGFVRREREIEDLKKHLESLRAEPAVWAAMGERGRRHLEQHHDPRQYARRLIELASEAVSFRSNAAALRLSRSIGSKLGFCTDPRARDLLARRSAEEILWLFGNGEETAAGPRGEAEPSARPAPDH